ncbi:C10 family peptidase [Bacteroides oleiciplenus]|uniref:Spi protease inhibitor domain-containing protein n=1 Tax=Bacteroides oleiciplenus TaxID=626931 RepID=A0A3E5B1K3_9BACE|nr:C10 family peptidase [Bacteroides oleiciplenus]RGN31412.1 hypothetical protein DXB65_21135 [Bacteroides oleiciplenus]
MKKAIVTLVFVFLICSGWLFAAPRTPQQALEIARTFVRSHVAMKHIDVKGLKLINGESIQTRTMAYPAYYIVNTGNDNGFVIISGDDCAREVLAYSDRGSLNYDHLPPNTKYWLEFYAAEMERMNENDGSVENPVEIQSSATRAIPPVIAPLLDKIEWDQGDPYNLDCPEERGEKTVTGCAATALAMVMKYYEYPKQGIGSYSYTTATLKKTLSVNYEEANYKWELMLPQYTSTATEEQKKAVAELMLHCGVAMDMDYNLNAAGGSGAGIFKQYNALTKQFGYNPNMYFEGRDYNSEGRWKNMIQKELMAGRPILYSGQSSGGGHAFVLDGCDEKDMYHFNWGWSGYANGYYSLSALEPGAGGTGSGSGAYNAMQYIMLLVQPETTGEIISGFTLEGSMEATKSQYARDESVGVRFTKIWNTATPMTGVIGLALYQGDEFVTFLTNPSAFSGINIGSGWNSITLSGTIPASVPNGSYQLHFASQKEGEKKPSMLRGLEDMSTYYNVEVTANSISLSNPGSKFELSQLAPAVLVGEAVEGKEMTFTLQVENKGMKYEDDFAVYIRKNGALLPYTRISDYTVIPGSASSTITISGNPGLPVGEYYAIGSYRKDDAWKQFTGNELRLVFTIKDVETGIEQSESIQPLKVITTSTGLDITSENLDEVIDIYSGYGMKITSIKGGKATVALSQSGLYIIRQGKNVLKVLYNSN